MISVIVPYKDSEGWLGRCLESLTTQTGDFEFIIVNDNSGDDGPEIAKRYAAADDRIRLFDNERGAGVSGARNTGLDHAEGEWFTFLDADDELLPRAWRTFQDSIRAGVNLIQFNHKRYLARTGREIVKDACNSGFYGLESLPDWWFGVWNKLLRRSVFGAVRFVEGMQYGEDGMYVLDCLQIDGKIYCAGRNNMTVRHRIENMKSLSHSKTAKDLMQICRAYEVFLEGQTNPWMQRVVCLELMKLWERTAKVLEKTMSSTS